MNRGPTIGTRSSPSAFRRAVGRRLLGLGVLLAVLAGPVGLAMDVHSAPPRELAADAAESLNDAFGFVFVNGVEEAGSRATPAESWYSQARGAGGAWNRWPIYWHKVETQRGRLVYDGAYNVDRVVEQDVLHGLRTNAILIGTPAWASATSALRAAASFDVARKSLGPAAVGPFEVGTPAAVPPGLDRPVFRADGSINPENTWASFVYQTVDRYRPGGVLARARGWTGGQGIRVWEMWNEPDSRFPVFWSAGPVEYARLLKVGALAARAADPSAVILFAGLAYWSQPDFLGQTLDRIAADPESAAANAYFDVLPLHLYVDPWHVYNVSRWARGELARRGLSKAIWVNETNAPIWGDSTGIGPGAWRATLDEQASFAVQVQALALAAGVERLFLFQLYEDGEPAYGIVRKDGSARPAYAAARTAAAYLHRTTFAGESRVGSVAAIAALAPDRGRITTVWNRSAQPVVAGLSALTPWATLVSRTGATQTLTAVGNVFTLTLGAGADHVYQADGQSIAWHADGEPVILVEPVYQVVSSRVEPLPALSSAGSFPVRWRRLDSRSEPSWYDVQYREGDGPWRDWIVAQPLTTAAFGSGYPVQLKPGTTYRFRSRARLDNQVEPWPEPAADGDAWTQVASHTLRLPTIRVRSAAAW